MANNPCTRADYENIPDLEKPRTPSEPKVGTIDNGCRSIGEGQWKDLDDGTTYLQEPGKPVRLLEEQQKSREPIRKESWLKKLYNKISEGDLMHHRPPF